MQGRRIALVGESQCGKTTLCKKILSMDKKKPYILSIKNNFERPIYMRMQDLLTDVRGKKNIIIIVDEAKSFIKKNEEWMELHCPQFLMLLRMAKEWNIFLIMVFHAFREVPVWLIPHLDGIERWETKEDVGRQQKRFADFHYVSESLLHRPHLNKYEHIFLKIET